MDLNTHKIAVPWIVVCDPDLSHGAKVAYSVLVAESDGRGYSSPTRREIAEYMGIDRRNVNKFIAELLDNDLISSGPQYGENGREANLYRLLAGGMP